MEEAEEAQQESPQDDGSNRQRSQHHQSTYRAFAVKIGCLSNDKQRHWSQPWKTTPPGSCGRKPISIQHSSCCERWICAHALRDRRHCFLVSRYFSRATETASQQSTNLPVGESVFEAVENQTTQSMLHCTQTHAPLPLQAQRLLHQRKILAPWEFTSESHHQYRRNTSALRPHKQKMAQGERAFISSS